MGISVDVSNFLKFETVKRAVGNPSYVWRNTYEVHVATPLTAFECLSIAQTFLDKEREFHTPNVQFLKCVVSSWQPEVPGEPYDPTTFVVQLGTGFIGSRAVGPGTPLPRNQTLLVRRQTAFGHNGKVSYRGVLGENDLIGNSALDAPLEPDSKTALQGLLSTMFSDITTALVASGGAGSELAMIHMSAEETPSIVWRPVTGFVVSGIRTVSPDHRYFDRAA